MDRKQIEAEHIVARYLADQLSPAEAEAFEAYYTEHPGMVRDIEHALRLKEGLAALRDRGQLDAIMRARKWNLALPLSIAAAITAAILGTWTWFGSHARAPVAASFDELTLDRQASLPLAGKYLLVRVRGAEPAVLEIPVPAARSALELQVLPAGGAAGAPYHLTLDRLSAQNSEAAGAKRVGAISGLTPGADGLVSAWLDSAGLQPGRHSVEITSTDTSVPAERFVIELR